MSSNPAMLGIITYGPAAARLGRASRAAVLAKRGASASTILRKTGYQRGVYGRGVETRGDAFLKPTATFGAKPIGTLAEVADVHPDIERAYPGVGSSLRVEVVPNNAWDERVAAARKALALWEANSTASAFYDRGNNLIAVRAQMPGESLSGYLDRADGSLVHELQHYAQHQDGLRPPRRHVDSHDYRVDGLEVEARNSAARRKLTPAERVEMPREMTQDVKPEDVRQAWRGGVSRNEITRVDVPAPARRMPEGTVPPVSVYDHPALDPSAKPPVLSLPTGSNPVARAVDAIPGRYVRNAVRGVVNGLGRAGETLLRVGGLVIDPSLDKAADVLGAHIDENAYEYHDNGPSDQEVRIAPVVEGLVKYGVLAWGGGSARGVLPAAVAADARHDTLSELRALGVPDSEAKFTADMNGLANGIIWGLPVGRAGGYLRRLTTGAAELGARGYLSARADTAVVDSVVDLEAMSGAERAAYEAENRAREAESALLTAGFAPIAAVSGPGHRRLPATRDVPLRLTNRDEKGGDNFGTFRNFLATDDVPESIFGIPVVQDESQYTEKDLKFFKENPKAAGFYDLGGEEVDGDVPQQAVKVGGPLVPATLSDEGRPMHMFRDEDGKVTGYGTTRSIVHESDGRFFVVPTIVPGPDGGTRVLGDDEAARRFSETGEHWGGYADRQAAEEAAEAVHERHARLYGRAWNDYIQDHWDEMSDEIRNDPGVLDARHARTRGAYPGSLNNPGNVEKRKERRQGEVDSPHERWAKFATPQDGLREMADAIRQIAAVKLAEKGLPFTIRNFAGVYAPSTENATAKYVADISADSGFDPDTELHRFDERDMAKFLKSVVRFESGAPHSAWFTDEEYAEAAKKLQEGAVD